MRSANTSQKAAPGEILGAPRTAPTIAQALESCYLHDAVTGNVLSLAIDNPKRFTVVGEAEADCVLRMVSDCDREIAGLDAKAKKAAQDWAGKALMWKRRREYLLARFKPELRAFSLATSAASTKKTLELAWGKLWFRRPQGSVKVVHGAEAVAWAKIHAPDAVKTTEEVLVSKIPDGLVKTLPSCFKVTEAPEGNAIHPDDNFSFDCGYGPH